MSTQNWYGQGSLFLRGEIDSSTTPPIACHANNFSAALIPSVIGNYTQSKCWSKIDTFPNGITTQEQLLKDVEDEIFVPGYYAQFDGGSEQCYDAGLTTSVCERYNQTKKIWGNTNYSGAACAGGPHSQIPFVDSSLTHEDDSGLRMFAAIQNTEELAKHMLCRCVEVEFGGVSDGMIDCTSNLSWVPEYTSCLSNQSKTSIIQFTNLGGMGSANQNQGTAQALFDISIPGGGFGDFNGCSLAWPNLYADAGGPCDPDKDTEKCRRYGGFIYNKTDGTGGGEYCANILNEEARETCFWMFGKRDNLTNVKVDLPFPLNTDGTVGNPFIRRIRRVDCPSSMSSRSGCPTVSAENGLTIDAFLSNSQRTILSFMDTFNTMIDGLD